MADERRFSVMAVLMEGPDHSDDTPIALVHFIHTAYDGQTKYSLDMSKAEGRKAYSENHIWKTQYAYSRTQDLLEALDYFVDYDMSLSDILVVIGEALDFRFLGDRVEFAKKLKPYAEKGLNVLIITDGLGELQDIGLENVRTLIIDKDTITDSLRSKNERWVKKAVEFKKFINKNFCLD